MNLTELLDHPSVNCPECVGSSVRLVAPGVPTRTNKIDIYGQCPNDFHTITPERTERELMGIVGKTHGFYNASDTMFGNTRYRVMEAFALSILMLLAKFVNARGIVPEEKPPVFLNPRGAEFVVHVVHIITHKQYREDHPGNWVDEAFAAIQSLATAAGIDLWKAIFEQLEELNAKQN